VRGELCPSCANREYELARGSNRKGGFPTVTAKKWNLRDWMIKYLDHGDVRYTHRRASSRVECILSVMRASRGAIVLFVVPDKKAQLTLF